MRFFILSYFILLFYVVYFFLGLQCDSFARTCFVFQIGWCGRARAAGVGPFWMLPTHKDGTHPCFFFSLASLLSARPCPIGTLEIGEYEMQKLGSCQENQARTAQKRPFSSHRVPAGPLDRTMTQGRCSKTTCMHSIAVRCLSQAYLHRNRSTAQVGGIQHVEKELVDYLLSACAFALLLGCTGMQLTLPAKKV